MKTASMEGVCVVGGCMLDLNHYLKNKMELLQSQAPADRELSESSAWADIGH